MHCMCNRLYSHNLCVPTGKNLRYVATHELGHAIGLQHSPEPDSIMTPYFVGQADNGLSLDDVQGVQALYGKRVS